MQNTPRRELQWVWRALTRADTKQLSQLHVKGHVAAGLRGMFQRLCREFEPYEKRKVDLIFELLYFDIGSHCARLRVIILTPSNSCADTNDLVKLTGVRQVLKP